MQQARIEQLENALAHLGVALGLQEQVWLRVRQAGRRTHSPQTREQMRYLVADVDQVKEHIIEARALVIEARGSRKAA